MSTTVNHSWEQAADILCVRLDSMGDLLMTTPAIRALKESSPRCRITLLTSTSGAEVAALIPEVDRIIAYDAPWMKATSPRASSLPEHMMARRLRDEGFDAAVIFTVFSQNPLPSAFLCYLADIPLRLAHCHENPYQLLTHWVVDPEPAKRIRHEVERQLDLVAFVGFTPSHERLSLRVPSQARDQVARMLERMGIDPGTPRILIHPGATAPSRRYPLESFAQVADQLVTDCGLPVVVTGSSSERTLVDEIRGQMRSPAHSLAGQLDLAQLAALIEMVPLVITNNTGPAHIAAAVGTPVVDLYALTNPQHTPWQVPSRVLFHDVPCRYCFKSICPEGHHNCLRQVSPDQVVRAALELLTPVSEPAPVVDISAS